MSKEQNLKKYQEESTNVSRVSVSRVYFLPSKVKFFHSWIESKGLPLLSKLDTSGNITGNNSLGILNGLLFSS